MITNRETLISYAVRPDILFVQARTCGRLKSGVFCGRMFNRSESLSCQRPLNERASFAKSAKYSRSKVFHLWVSFDQFSFLVTKKAPVSGFPVDPIFSSSFWAVKANQSSSTNTDWGATHEAESPGFYLVVPTQHNTLFLPSGIDFCFSWLIFLFKGKILLVQVQYHPRCEIKEGKRK